MTTEQQKVAEATTERPVVTQEIIRAKFDLALAGLKYQDALTKFNSWQITPENIADTQTKIKNVRGFIRKLADIKAVMKEPALTECRYWDAAYNDILTPLQTSLSAKEKELQTIVDKIAEENRLKEKERQRVEGIKSEIDNFILQQSRNIAAATTHEQLVNIEKLIGSNKGNKNRYQEFLPELVERCNELTPIIKQQKEHIKELQRIELEKMKAEKQQDDRKLLELQEQQEVIQHSIDEKKIQVQEEAIHQATRPDEVQTVLPQQQAIRYRRQAWKWEVKDIKLLAKKAPHLVILMPDEEKIDELLKTKRADGSLDDKEELEVMGIRFYLEKKA